MTEELLNALKVIKAECEKRVSCKDCPLYDRYECGVTQGNPEEWALQKREVFF